MASFIELGSKLGVSITSDRKNDTGIRERMSVAIESNPET